MGENRKLKDAIMSKVLNLGDNNRVVNYYNYNLLPNLTDYNKADTVNMNNEEMNKFRHIAGSAQSINDIGVLKTLNYGLGKELRDLLYGDDLKDTLFDLKNNARGFKIHFQRPGLEDKPLNDYVFNNYIKPYRK